MNFEIEHDACGIGTVVQIDGKQSYDVLDKALHIVEKLEHRAGKDASGKVGDGVGILLQISDDFFRKTLKKDNIKLPEHYGVGMFFLPRNKRAQHKTFATWIQLSHFFFRKQPNVKIHLHSRPS